MADTKISALSAGTAAPGDEIPVNRAGSNFKITAGDILKINGGTITANSPVLDLTQTWNNAAVTFTGLKFNVPTDSSASGSLLMDLQVGGVSQFSVSKAGVVLAPTSFRQTATGAGIVVNSNGSRLVLCSNNTNLVYLDGSNFTFASSGSLNWSTSAASSGSTDISLTRDAAGTLAQRNSTNAQTFRLYGTYTDASNYRRLASTSTTAGAFTLSAEGLGTGATGNTLAFATDGTTWLTLNATGVLTGNSWFQNIFIGSGTTRAGQGVRLSSDRVTVGLGYFGMGPSGSVDQDVTLQRGGAAGVLTLGNAPTITDFSRLQFGGTTSSFPALKRSGAGLICRLADDSANAAFEAASLKTDAPAGGTAATWKLGAVATVSPTSPNRTIEVDIGGTIYYLHAKTTND